MREITWFGFFLVITLALAHAWLDGTALLRDAPLVIICAGVTLATAATVAVVWSADRAAAKARAEADLAQMKHDAKMRRMFPDHFQSGE